MSEHIPATRANMERFGAYGVVAYSPDTGEIDSATPGDYFMMDPSDCLTDSEGNPMVLARRIPEHFEPLTNDDTD